MLALNLLSPAKKQEIRLTHLYIMIKNLIIIILLFTILVAIILLLTKMTLQNHFSKIVGQNTLTTKYGNIFNKDIKTFNQRLSTVSKIQDEYIIWTNFLAKFTQIIPDDVIIYRLEIDGSKDARIKISGMAKTRTRLLQLKDNLENNDLFSGAVVPLESLLKKENIDFNIEALINLDKITR